MIFQELTLLNFGKFQNKKFSFEPGINLIVGKNEAGKSTLFQAIFGILFGFKNDRDRFLPWRSSSHYAARLLIENTPFRIQIERDFTEDKVAFVQEDLKSHQTIPFHGRVSPLGRSSEREVYLRKLHDLFGFTEPEIFKTSLFIEQRSLPELPAAQTAIELKTLISNISDFNYDHLIKRLEERYFQMTKKNPHGIDKRNDRLLENIRRRIGECEIQIQKAREAERHLFDLSCEIAEIRDKLKLKEQKLKKWTAHIEALKQIGKVSKKETETKKIFLDFQKKKDLVEKLLAQQKELEREKPEFGRNFAIILISGGLALPLLAILTKIGWFWLLFLFLGFFGYGIHHFLAFRKEASKYGIRELRLKSQLEVLPDIKTVTEEYLQSQKSLREIEYQKSELEKNVSAEALSESILDKESEKEILEQDIHDLQEMYQAKRQQYIFSSKGLESPFTLEEELYDLKEQAKHLQIKAEALLTAKRLLSEMVIEFRKEHMRLFAENGNRFFKEMVEDDFRAFSFEEDALSPLFSLNGKPIPFSSLSCGTQDQIFFAIKLSLLHSLNGERSLPLFLDDPFVNFDYERRKKALALLKKIASRHQLFLFTYDPWYAQELKEAHFINMEEI